MKVYPNKLPELLRKGGQQVFIVSGDEPLLVQESCDLIRGELKKQGFTEREVFHAEPGFDWNSLLYSGNSMSLFADRKLMEIRLPTGKPGDAGGKALTELLESRNDETAILVVLPRADQSTQRTKWFKTVESAAAFVQVWPIEAKELPRWLEGRFRQAGLRADREAIRTMAERIEGNLLAAIQEIERLKLIVGDRAVTVNDVTEGVADSARYDVFKMIDAALVGDVSRCVRMTDGLRAEGVESLFVVNMLAREIRSLESIKTDLQNGLSQREVFKKARVWDKRVPVVSRCLDRHDLTSLRSLQVSLGSIDRMVKGLVQGDPWRSLQEVILSLAGTKQFL
ncbi:MAG: DNA polymerase III subunit delta [Pseudomonadales bacterium]|nr:DNA polymerase III subunit delta [Pseudomonadales bacterium]MBO6597957.1 DNA polymerase III subunit delta [Pseudomonadales bacterium]MBO6823021.1 DNA polymerase III subunit delta [Pseudomonadales bacterium]